jgi:hypothetical protein
MPTGLLDGINYNTADASKATLISVERFYICLEALTIGTYICLFDEKRDRHPILVVLTGLTSGVNYINIGWEKQRQLLIPHW